MFTDIHGQLFYMTEILYVLLLKSRCASCCVVAARIVDILDSGQPSFFENDVFHIRSQGFCISLSSITAQTAM